MPSAPWSVRESASVPLSAEVSAQAASWGSGSRSVPWSVPSSAHESGLPPWSAEAPSQPHFCPQLSLRSPSQLAATSDPQESSGHPRIPFLQSMSPLHPDLYSTPLVPLYPPPDPIDPLPFRRQTNCPRSPLLRYPGRDRTAPAETRREHRYPMHPSLLDPYRSSVNDHP